MDFGHKKTEEMLAELEKRIYRLYSQSAKEMQGVIDEYFASFEKRDAAQKKLLEAGEITDQQYKLWRIAQMGRGERFKDLRDKLAERALKANETAVAYINDATPGVYTLNRNYCAYTIEQVAGNVGFTLWDEETVRRLAVEEPNLMPNYPAKRAVQRGIDLAYSKEQITATVTSAILQGKSIGKIANDLQARIETMGRSSAVRAARTAYTAAQNGGRQDSYEKAAEMGIKVRKRWVATKDGRTRDSHRDLDGQTVDYDKPFISSLGSRMMFPGDRSAKPGDLYNCRCRMRTVEKEGIEAEPRQMRVRDPETGRNVLVSEMTYQEWESWKENIAPIRKSDRIGKNGGEVGAVHIIGKIDAEKYKCVNASVITNEVVMTDERVDHIRERHPNDYERFKSYIPRILADPDYIIEANKPNTAVVLKEIEENGEKFKLILRLKVQTDPAEYKNSVLSFWHIGDTTWKKTIKNKNILYKKE